MYLNSLSAILEIFLKEGNPDNEKVLVWDPFCGTGTTGVAAAHFGAKFYGTEKEKNVFTLAFNRIHAAYDKAGRLEESSSSSSSKPQLEETPPRGGNPWVNSTNE